MWSKVYSKVYILEYLNITPRFIWNRLDYFLYKIESFMYVILCFRIGRKAAIIIAGLAAALFGISKSFATTYLSYIVLEWFEATFGENCSPAFILGNLGVIFWYMFLLRFRFIRFSFFGKVRNVILVVLIQKLLNKKVHWKMLISILIYHTNLTNIFKYKWIVNQL